MRARLSQHHGGAPSWALAVLGLAGLALLPWAAGLAVALPKEHVARHWDVAWAGFDVGLAVVLLAIVAAAWRGSRWLGGIALAGAVMLVCDVWFDVVTSVGTSDLWLAIALAVVVELPLTILCVAVAAGTLQHRRG